MTNSNQGEGDKASARHYNEAQHQFARSGKVEQAARDAAPRDAGDAQEMQRAEAAGKARAKDEDPTIPGANAAHPRKNDTPGV